MADRIELLEQELTLDEPALRGETGIAGWLEQGQNRLFTLTHSPVGSPAATGVIIVPPFGWQELASHRARRYWATRLARAGFLTLRYDLPATGDSSGSPRDPGLFDAWVESVAACTDHLRQADWLSRVAVIGIGLGGLIASVALTRGAEIDDLFLWGVQSRGRATLREMTAYAGMVTSEYAADRADEDLHGGLDLAGFFLSEETRATLTAIDLGEATLPTRSGARALLVGRDGTRPDSTLESLFTGAGISVEATRGNDFADLMTPPQDPLLRRPETTIMKSIVWLEQASKPDHALEAVATDLDTANKSGSAVAPSDLQTTLSTTHGAVNETIVPISANDLTTYAIVSTPASGAVAPVAAVILGPGAIRKVGLHRMSVEIARRWAAQGVTTIRFDVGAVGDASGPEDGGADERPMLTSEALMAPPRIETVAQIIGQLRQAGLFDRFVTVGHCSGGYLAFQSALETEGAVGCISINQPAIIHSNDLYQALMFRKLLQAFRGGLVRRWRQNRLTLRELRWAREAVVHRLRVRGGEATAQRNRDDAILILDTLALRQLEATMVMTRGNALVEALSDPEFPDLTRWPSLHIEHLPTHDDLYHALKFQKAVHAHVDAALKRILDAPTTS